VKNASISEGRVLFHVPDAALRLPRERSTPSCFSLR
jgi:hypothetical protein